MLVPKHHSPTEGTRAPWRSGCFQAWGRENTDELEHPEGTESKKGLKTQKGTQRTEASTCWKAQWLKLEQSEQENK